MKLLTGLTFLICILFPSWLLAQNTKDSLQIAVISDVHIMSPELLKADGEAFQNYVKHDRKMLKESPELLGVVIDRLLEVHPQVVLIPGDLTKDGEYVSHHFLADRYLSKLKSAGIRVFVVPGNHDVNNPHAEAFNGKEKERVRTVTPEEFAGCYASYGYGEAIARDEASLSYVVQFTDSVRLLCIDACKYKENDYDKNICVTGGRIKPETMSFIEIQTADARAKGMRVMAMMHHGIVQHWKWQDKVMKEYLVDDWKK